jgi:hypothetical protein
MVWNSTKYTLPLLHFPNSTTSKRNTPSSLLICSKIGSSLSWPTKRKILQNLLIDIQQSFFKSYLKRSVVEKAEENMPYTSDKIKQFKVSVLQESKNILVLKYQTAYLSNQTC